MDRSKAREVCRALLDLRRTRDGTSRDDSTAAAEHPYATDRPAYGRSAGQPVDRAPAYLASPYPVYHREYCLPTQYNPSYAIPPSNLPLFPARTPDWSPSRSLWYSGRSVPWYFGYWYYPRYIPVQHALPVEPLLQEGAVDSRMPVYPAMEAGGVQELGPLTQPQP